MAFGLPSDFRFDIHARDRSGAAWRGVQSNMERTQRAGSALLRTLGPLLGVGGAAVGATMLADMARRSLEFADTLVAAADRTSFAVDELERLRFAGYQNRIEFGQTDMALQRFSRRLAEAAQGSGELRADLQRMGIQLRDSNGSMRSSYDILLDFADVVANAESEQEQLRLAFKAFDSEGAAFVNVLREGRAGLEAYARAAEEADAVMGDGLARSAAEANRRLREMQQTLQGQFNTAVAENADDLAAFAEALGDIVQLAIEAASAIGALYDVIQRDMDASPQEARVSQLENTRRMLMSQIEANQASIEEYAYDPRYQRLAENAQRENEELLGIIEGLDRQIEELEQRAAQERARRGDPAAPPGASDQSAGPRHLAMPDDDWGAGVSPRFAPRNERDAANTARLEADLRSMYDDLKDAAVALSTAQVEALKEQLEQNREDFSRTFAGAFADGVMAAFDGDLQEYLRRRLYQAAYNGLYEAFTRAGNYLFDRLSQSGGGVLSSVFSLFSFGGGKAGGGPVQPGLVYRVGERGPEDVVFGAPGHVMSAEQSMGAGAPVYVLQRFELNASGAVMTEDLVNQMNALAQAAEARAVARTAGAAKQNAVRQSKRLK